MKRVTCMYLKHFEIKAQHQKPGCSTDASVKKTLGICQLSIKRSSLAVRKRDNVPISVALSASQLDVPTISRKYIYTQPSAFSVLLDTLISQM